MVGGQSKGAKKRSTTAAANSEVPPKSLKVKLLNPSQLLLEIPSETIMSMPVWTAIKSQQVCAVWTVNPHSISVSLTPVSKQIEGTSNQSETEIGRSGVMMQTLPQSNSDALSLIQVKPLQNLAPVSSYIATLPVIITRPQPALCPRESETPQTSVTLEHQQPLPDLHFHTRSGSDVAICDNFLISICPVGEHCVKHHTTFPFHWQLRSITTGQWIDVPRHAQFGLEKRYCNVAHNAAYIREGEEVYSLDFESMQLEPNSKYNGIRRLVNSDSPKENPHFPAEWNLYWWDDYKWTQYNKRTSTALLKKMKDVNGKECSFHVLSTQYKVNFKTMKQTNVQSGYERDIRRRPRYRSLDAMRLYLRTITQEDHDPQPHGANFCVDALKDFQSWYPPVWCPTLEQDYSVVDVPNNTEAYWSILAPFFESIPEISVDIISVQQVQNLFQWDKYQRHKVFMMNKYQRMGMESKVTLEKHLFHGTNKGVTEAICQNNFDPRLAGQENGAAHGFGTYFATRASLSDTFTCKSGTEEVRHIFLAKVLVGMSTQGMSSYRRPPLVKSGPKKYSLYDSCVDQRSSPTSYIVFDSCQCYPYSLIKYRYVTTPVTL